MEDLNFVDNRAAQDKDKQDDHLVDEEVGMRPNADDAEVSKYARLRRPKPPKKKGQK